MIVRFLILILFTISAQAAIRPTLRYHLSQGWLIVEGNHWPTNADAWQFEYTTDFTNWHLPSGSGCRNEFDAAGNITNQVCWTQAPLGDPMRFYRVRVLQRVQPFDITIQPADHIDPPEWVIIRVDWRLQPERRYILQATVDGITWRDWRALTNKVEWFETIPNIPTPSWPVRMMEISDSAEFDL